MGTLYITHSFYTDGPRYGGLLAGKKREGGVKKLSEKSESRNLSNEYLAKQLLRRTQCKRLI